VTQWVDTGSPATVTGISSNPTKPSSFDVDAIYWRRNGSIFEIRYNFQASSASGAANGSGDYLWALPTGMSISTTHPFYTGTIDSAHGSEIQSSLLLGNGAGSVDSSSHSSFRPSAYDGTHVRLVSPSTMNAISGGSVFSMNTAELGWSFYFAAQHANWRA
jgi:hypothetical protein